MVMTSGGVQMHSPIALLHYLCGDVVFKSFLILDLGIRPAQAFESFGSPS